VVAEKLVRGLLDLCRVFLWAGRTSEWPLWGNFGYVGLSDDFEELPRERILHGTMITKG
jgi:hypothetical protein